MVDRLDRIGLAARIFELVPTANDRARLSADDRANGAALVDDLLRKVFRGKGALALRIGEYLHWLDRGDRLLTLGYHKMVDFAREECGLTAADARAYRRLAQALETRPLLRAAVQAGEVSPLKAERVKGVAVGEAEAHWVARATELSVRGLMAEVKVEQARRAREQAGDDVPPGPSALSAMLDDEGDAEGAAPGWHRLTVRASREELVLFKNTLALGRRALGAGVGPGRCVEAWPRRSSPRSRPRRRCAGTTAWRPGRPSPTRAAPGSTCAPCSRRPRAGGRSSITPSPRSRAASRSRGAPIPSTCGRRSSGSRSWRGTGTSSPAASRCS